MASGLKGLIAATCIVIIAGGAYFGWNAFEKNQATNRTAASTEEARKELFDLASANDNEPERVRTYCSLINDELGKRITDNDYSRNILRNCRALGYL
ncbi:MULTISPECIES: hypothetical protein [unclassified Rhizobium]|uniref:hypothetical protein n=1 Tax=unclassified Rhizobium TaxID=2613769 RepID=UPI000CF2237F|nr:MULTISPECIES: hypothetical protein [Rhizobium]UWU19632.1 hypothetical protein N2601_09920 [Rhizobium tropici]